MRSHILSFSSVFAMSLLASCTSTKENPNHCQNQNGNDWCAEKHPDGSLPYCAIGACPEIDAIDGCVADRPADDACYSPCGDDQTFEDDPSCDGIADTGTDATTLTTSMSDTTPTDTTDDPSLTTSMSMSASESETEVTSETDPTTGPTGCVSSLECTDPGAPICDDMVCVPCTEAPDGDTACEAKDATAPACRKDGECVQCTSVNLSACGDVTPVCDDGSSSCVGCDYHEQCAGTACDMATGACFDDTCLVDVFDADDIAGEIADGCVIRVHGGAYPEILTISGDTVALLSAGDGDAYLQGVGGGNTAPALTVTGGANVYVQGLFISDNDDGVGVEVSSATLYLDRTQVVNNDTGGIAADSNADVHLRNCFIGGSITNVAAVDVTGASIDISYSSVGAGFGATAVALRCSGVGVVNVSDSLLVAQGASPTVDCTTDSFTRSATEDEIGAEMNDNWFADYADGDFRLTGMAPRAILTTAEWNTGDPVVDIDGEDRPNVDATADVAGADVPQ